MSRARQAGRLDAETPVANNGDRSTPAVVVVEHPDSSGRRWQIALDLLLEAGRASEERA